jgi:hypothetical protein
LLSDLSLILLRHGKFVHGTGVCVFAKSGVLNIKTAALFHAAMHILAAFFFDFCTLKGIKM